LRSSLLDPISSLENELTSPDFPNKGNLWQAWHYLQVYSTWGLRVPHSRSDLKMYLKIEDDTPYRFFSTMLEANETIHNCSFDFQQSIFPKVVKLGTSLKDFAEDNRSSDDSVWTVIDELMEDQSNVADVLTLIKDLQSQAESNMKEADEVAGMLGSYSANLEIASGKLQLAGQSVEDDDKTSTATIEKLQGGADVMGSLAQIEEIATNKSKEYEHNKVVAATTPSYAWAGPFGLIAAAVIAGVYGDRAVKALKSYNDAIKRIEEGQKELSTAIKAHEVYKVADNGISKSKEYTDRAIRNVTVVKNAWAALVGNLQIVLNKVDAMTKTTDEGEILKSKILIKRYTDQSRKAWDKLWPSIVELTTDPYIQVDQEEKSVKDIITEIEVALKDPALSN